MAAVFGAVAADPVAGAGTVGARWRGRLVLAVDSFVVDVPESVANREVFGGPTGGTGGLRDLGYPQVRVLTLAECGTHGLRAAAIGPFGAGERDLAGQVLGGLDERHVVLFDAGFPSVELIRKLNATGAAWVMRADRRIGHRGVEPLPDGSATAVLVESGHSKCVQCEHRVRVRVIDYRVDGGGPIRLLTNLLDPQAGPAGEIAALYAERWQTEHANREIKTIQQGPGYVLRSHSPELVRAEIFGHLALHVVLNRLAVELADRNGRDPDRISFVKVLKHARRTVIAQITQMAAAVRDDLRRWLNPARAPRSSDRTIKRTRKRYNRRNAPTGTKPVTIRIPPRTITPIPIRA
jgi:Transposase DDE domain